MKLQIPIFSRHAVSFGSPLSGCLGATSACYFQLDAEAVILLNGLPEVVSGKALAAGFRVTTHLSFTGG